MFSVGPESLGAKSSDGRHNLGRSLRTVSFSSTVAIVYLTFTRIPPLCALENHRGVIMSDFLPQDVRDGLELARKQKQRKKSRMRVKAGDQTFTILRYWDQGFALDADEAPNLRGLVDVFDGARHLSQCLIVTSEEASGERVFEFKRSTPYSETPAVDYELREDAPVALIGYRSILQ